MSGPYRVLLVESDDIVMGMMQKNIRSQFPEIELDSASTPDAAMELLERNQHEIVICDAFLRSNERIPFIGAMCHESALLLIIITAETTITAETFSPHVKESCIHHVLYKPLDFGAFLDALQCAIFRVKARRAGANPQ